MKNDNIYIINTNTVALLPHKKDGILTTKIIELNKIIFNDATPLNIVKRSLLHYGNNLRGAREASSYHLGNGRRLPIMIAKENNIYLYTTTSMTKNENIWFSIFHTNRIKKIDRYRTHVVFNNNTELSLNISYTVLYNNYLKGIQLKNALDNTISGNYDHPNIKNSYELPNNEKKMIVAEPSSLRYVLISKLPNENNNKPLT